MYNGADRPENTHRSDKLHYYAMIHTAEYVIGHVTTRIEARAEEGVA